MLSSEPFKILVLPQTTTFPPTSIMSPAPQWVKDLKPSGPQGSELLKAEREKSKISVDKLSNFLFTKKALDRQETILKILQADPIFDKSQNYFDGRVDRFKTALARAKRLRQLQVKHNWDRDEFIVANDLIAEPGPYGLHASMYLVRISHNGFDMQLTISRPHSATRVHQSNTSSSSNLPRTTRQSDVMHKQNLATDPMFGDWRPPPPGTQRIKPSFYILHT